MRELSKLNYQSTLKSMQKNMQEMPSPANVMFKGLLEEIQKFESGLNPDEEIGAYLTSLAGGVSLHIEEISYRDPYYIVLSGTTKLGQTEKDQKVRLVQHITQTSILFVPVKVTPGENREPRRFGFKFSDDED